MVRLVVGQGLGLVLAAVALSRLLTGFLYQVSPTDPTAFLAVAAAMLTVGLAACWLPAQRAAAVDPATTLRSA